MSFFLFFLAILLAATMGYAIQRGGTCTMAAVDEVLTKGRADRLLALLEAAIWVLGGLLIAQALGLEPPMPAGYAVTGWIVLGAALLGVGAAVNRACVFGTIARIGTGDWAYLATPVGFYVGCLLGQAPLASYPPHKLAEPALAFQAPTALAWVIVAWMVWRVVKPLMTRPVADSARAKALLAKVWQPHAATLVIAVTFLLMLWLVGAWTYTDVLAEWAQGMVSNALLRGLLLLALLAGAVLGGWTAGQFRATRLSLAPLTRCSAGGVLMGLGSSLIPGGNDGLLLTGMPLLWPHAWLAFAVMCVTIAVYQKTTQFLQK